MNGPPRNTEDAAREVGRSSITPSIIYIHEDYESLNGQTAESKQPWKLLPNLFASTPLDNGRIALGLGTDLGGYSIMLGGTGGPHLGSFSLIDVLSHGRACALLNPYYTVLFAPVIQKQLEIAAEVFKGAGYISEDVKKLHGRDLGLAVAMGMIAFAKDLNFPITLKEAGATREHLERMLTAAKNPQLKMKLQNMPTPMDAPAEG